MNWRVRIKNKLFWMAVIPAVLYLATTVAKLFGYELDLSGVGDNLLAVVEAVFGVLIVLGVVVDPTTAGVGDSKLAMTYDEPKPRGE